MTKATCARLGNLIPPGLLKILALTLASAGIAQMDWWWRHNGVAWRGTCVNHFGEPYACDVWVWLLRGLGSPFAWPALILLCLVWWLALWVGFQLVRRLVK
jgi:hypothetical protein